MSETTENSKTSPHIWVLSTYFAEGFPYAIVHQVAEVLFKEMNASLQAIGLTSLFHLPWNLKFLWGPFLDAYATKRKWLLWTEILLTGSLVALAFSAIAPNVLVLASIAFVLIALLSATHDIAIDGYYLEGLNEEQQSQFVGYRAASYKVAMLMVGGPFLALIAWTNWFVGLLILAAAMAVILIVHWAILPKQEVQQRPMSELVARIASMRMLGIGLLFSGLAVGLRMFSQSLYAAQLKEGINLVAPALLQISIEGWIGLGLMGGLLGTLAALPLLKRRIYSSDSFYARAFVDFLDQPQIGRILAFVILFRCGESLLLKMRYPFFSDLGMSLTEFSLASGTIGLILSFTATLLGGYLISRFSLRKCIWPFVWMQNGLNLVFAALGYWAMTLPEGQPIGFVILAGAIGLESWGSGLGTAVFMVYLMRCCRPDFKAAHMAIVTALMSISFTLAGVASGFLADQLGYGHYFVLSFIATLPGMALIPFIPHLDRSPAP